MSELPVFWQADEPKTVCVRCYRFSRLDVLLGVRSRRILSGVKYLPVGNF